MTAQEIGRRMVMCADDFGSSDAASSSIIELASVGAISAVSCLIDAPGFSRSFKALVACRDRVAIGLHLNLTEGQPQRLRRPLPHWMLRAYSASLPRRDLVLEIARQLDAFEDAFNGAPSFVDGHEHVHQLPRIRDALVREIVRRYGRRVAVRSTAAMKHRGTKSWAIARLGGNALLNLLRARQIATNSDFAGAYDFSLSKPYHQRLANWLYTLRDGGLVMCHPERSTGSQPARAARQAEHDYLASAAWPKLLQMQNIRLVPFSAAEFSNTETWQRIAPQPRAGGA